MMLEKTSCFNFYGHFDSKIKGGVTIFFANIMADVTKRYQKFKRYTFLFKVNWASKLQKIKGILATE